MSVEDFSVTQRLIEIERALDKALYDATRSHYHFLQRDRYAPANAPASHTTLVMSAIYEEAARQNDLTAPLAGALSFNELSARTNLTEENLDRALWTLIVEQKRLRTRDEGSGRFYFLPALTRKMLRKSLNSVREQEEVKTRDAA